MIWAKNHTNARAFSWRHFCKKKLKIIFFLPSRGARELKLLSFESETKTKSGCSKSLFSKKSSLSVRVHSTNHRINLEEILAYFQPENDLSFSCIYWGQVYETSVGFEISLFQICTTLRSKNEGWCLFDFVASSNTDKLRILISLKGFQPQRAPN